MKSPDDAHFQQWADNPEPTAVTLDPQTILDTDVSNHDAYLWESQNCQDGWLAYNGKLLEQTP